MTKSERAEAAKKELLRAVDDDTTARLDAVYATEDSQLDPVLAELQRVGLSLTDSPAP